MSSTAKVILGIIVLVLVFWGGNALKTKKQNQTGQVSVEKVKIGFMGPLSGDAASYGESIKRGVELAQKEIGGEIEIVFEDSKCDGKEAVNAINKLISADKVQAIIGEVCSGGTLAAAPIAEQNKVVMLSAASTSPKISEAGAYIFRVVPSDALQGDFGAKLVYDKGFRKLAILYSNEEYGVGFQSVLKESFEKQGGKVVASETFERGSVDLRTQLLKIKLAKPDAMYLISNSPDSAVAALKQNKELAILGSNAVFGSEGLKSQDIIDGAKESAEGLILTTVSSGTSDFIERHKKEYGSEPGPFAAQGYDAYQALALAVKGGASSGTDIKNKLTDLEFDGASGKIKFDERGDIEGNYDVYVIKDGKFELSK